MSKLYFVSNTEWSFEVEEADIFNTRELALMMLARIQTHNRKIVEQQAVDIASLQVTSVMRDVVDHLHFRFN